jgi:hypothetical protein
MKISKPFTLRILNTRELHPLQAASNQSGDRLVEMDSQTTYEAPKRASKVIANGLILPEKDSPLYENLPESLKIKKNATPAQIRNARNALWLSVSWNETRNNAQFAREFELPLPPDVDLSLTQNAVESFAADALVSQGMIADMAIHETYVKDIATGANLVSSRTAYLLCTTRPFINEKFANKTREWNSFETLRNWRQDWFDALKSILPEASEDNSQATTDLIRFAARFSSRPTIVKTSRTRPHEDIVQNNHDSIEIPAEPVKNQRRL